MICVGRKSLTMGPKICHSKPSIQSILTLSKFRKMHMRIILIVLHLYQCFNLVSATNDKPIFKHSETSAFRTVAKPKIPSAPAPAAQQLPVASATSGAESPHGIDLNLKLANEHAEKETDNQKEKHSPSTAHIQQHSQKNLETVPSGKHHFDLNLLASEYDAVESVPVNADTMEVQQSENKQLDKGKNKVNEEADMQILEEETAAPSNAGLPMDEENVQKEPAAERIDKGKGPSKANEEATDDDVQILDKWEFVGKEKPVNKLALKLNEDLTFKNKHWDKIRKRFHKLVEEGKLGREHMDMLGLPMPKKQREEPPQKEEYLQKKQEQELADLVKRMTTYNIVQKIKSLLIMSLGAISFHAEPIPMDAETNAIALQIGVQSNDGIMKLQQAMEDQIKKKFSEEIFNKFFVSIKDKLFFTMRGYYKVLCGCFVNLLKVDEKAKKSFQSELLDEFGRSTMINWLHALAKKI